MSTEPERESPEQLNDDAVPVCSGCFSPIDPGTNYCATCGSAVGQHTEYVPFVNIPWQVSGYDRLRQSTWPTNGSVFGRIIGALAALLLAPLLLFAMPFKWLAKRRKAQQR